MPAYGIPGVSTTRRTSLVVGAFVLVAVIATGVVWRSITPTHDAGTIQIQLRTSFAGDGIVAGTGVRLNGVQIGRVSAVDSSPGGSQTITLALQQNASTGLSDAVDIEYAPANLFGISEVVLRRGDGGAPLADGAVVDLTAPDRVSDATMGSLLRTMSDTTLTVLTPQLSEVLTQIGTDVRAFAPFIEAMVGVSRAVADTQRFPSSFLIEQYAAFFDGIAKFGSGFVQLIDQVYGIDMLRNDRALFDTGVGLVVDQLLPLVSDVLGTAQGYVSGYADTTAVVLGQLARTVPDPGRSHADLTELLDRLDRTFAPTPQGPQVGVELVVRGMPGVMVPLLGGGTR